MEFMWGTLLYDKHNTYTQKSSHSPYYTVNYKYNFNKFSDDEKYIVGTHCGTQPFNEERINYYVLFKQNNRVGLSLLEQLKLKNFQELDKYFYGNDYHSFADSTPIEILLHDRQIRLDYIDQCKKGFNYLTL